MYNEKARSAPYIPLLRCSAGEQLAAVAGRSVHAKFPAARKGEVIALAYRLHFFHEGGALRCGEVVGVPLFFKVHVLEHIRQYALEPP